MPADDLRADTTVLELVHTEHQPWSPSPALGVERKRLERTGPAEAGRVTSVVRYAPGSRFPQHPHPDGEEILVLEGVFTDERGDHPAGTYLLNPEGFVHAPSSQPGCVLFVKLRQYPGVGRTAVRCRLSPEAWQRDPTLGIESVVLHATPTYPEQMHAVRLPAGATVPLPSRGGFEAFVLDGACKVGSHALRVGSWIRHPASSETVLVETEESCTMYVKHGHLVSS